MTMAVRPWIWVAGLLACGVVFAQGGKPAAAPKSYEPGKVYNALQPMLPAGVAILDTQVNGDRAIVAGSARSNAQVSQFMRNLDTAAEFRAPELRQIRMEGGRVQYDIGVTIDCAAGGKMGGGILCAKPAKAGSLHRCRVNGTLTFQGTPCRPGEEA
jgi:hypothetical protein